MSWKTTRLNFSFNKHLHTYYVSIPVLRTQRTKITKVLVFHNSTETDLNSGLASWM